MLLYQNQLVKLKRYHNRPAIFLGFDKKIDNRIWVACVKPNVAPEIDWFNQSDVDYFLTPATFKGSAYNQQITFGKFCKKSFPLPYYSNEPTKEEFTKYIEYVKELITKYIETEKNEEQISE